MKKPSLISRILASFGYAKVPKEAVQLSLWVESRMEWMFDNLKSEPGKKFYSELLTAQRELTKLLRAGRLLSK